MILLDTHVAIWLVASPRRLSQRARLAIHAARQSGDTIACSAASLFEIVYVTRQNRIPLVAPQEDFIAAVRRTFDWAPLTAEIAVHAAELTDPFHGDPLDRMIAATAIAENCTLITADEKILNSGVCKTLW